MLIKKNLRIPSEIPRNIHPENPPRHPGTNFAEGIPEKKNSESSPSKNPQEISGGIHKRNPKRVLKIIFGAIPVELIM